MCAAQYRRGLAVAAEEVMASSSLPAGASRIAAEALSAGQAADMLAAALTEACLVSQGLQPVR